MHLYRGIILFLPRPPLHTELYVNPRVITLNVGEGLWQCCRFADSKFRRHSKSEFFQFCRIIYPEGTSYVSTEFTLAFHLGFLPDFSSGHG